MYIVFNIAVRSYYIFRLWRGENFKYLASIYPQPPFKTKPTVEILIK